MPILKALKSKIPQLDKDVLIIADPDENRIKSYLKNKYKLDDNQLSSLLSVEGELGINHSKEIAELSGKSFQYISQLPKDEERWKLRFKNLDMEDKSSQALSSKKIYTFIEDSNAYLFYPPIIRFNKEIEAAMFDRHNELKSDLFVLEKDSVRKNDNFVSVTGDYNVDFSKEELLNYFKNNQYEEIKLNDENKQHQWFILKNQIKNFQEKNDQLKLKNIEKIDYNDIINQNKYPGIFSYNEIVGNVIHFNVYPSISILKKDNVTRIRTIDNSPNISYYIYGEDNNIIGSGISTKQDVQYKILDFIENSKYKRIKVDSLDDWFKQVREFKKQNINKPIKPVDMSKYGKPPHNLDSDPNKPKPSFGELTDREKAYLQRKWKKFHNKLELDPKDEVDQRQAELAAKKAEDAKYQQKLDADLEKTRNERFNRKQKRRKLELDSIQIKNQEALNELINNSHLKYRKNVLIIDSLVNEIFKEEISDED